jgi:NADH:ubiquinone oxidoreductase subunit 5 (subunit L)/multisubunit Na+/H+ antiporter MnhA subunit
MAFTVTTTGGLCLLGGMLILGHIAGSYELDMPCWLPPAHQVRACASTGRRWCWSRSAR